MEQGEIDRLEAPLRTKDVWSIRTKLQVEKRSRDLAMFNLAIDSKLRGCDDGGLEADEHLVTESFTDAPIWPQLRSLVRLQRRHP